MLLLAFCLRLAFGLSSTFWAEDERQVYLIGLRSFARDRWPFFGADVVWTGGQLPGAMQGWLVRFPFEIWPAPEAPFVLLNLLSVAALALFAWYLRRRFPDLPAWLVWGALFTLPWTVNFSTQIVNTSYILPGAIVFFVGFFEAAPRFRAGLLNEGLAWTLMGAGLFFLVQIHMSWVLLPPYVLFAAVGLVRTGKVRRLAIAGAGFVAGAATTGSLLLPTILLFGLSAGATNRVIEFHAQDPSVFLTIAARFFSFASFETNRFIGVTTAERLMFLWRQPWVLPFVVIATLAGLVQPIAMAIAWFRQKNASAEWRDVRWLVALTLMWIYASFFFSIRGPLAHAFYVVMPIALLYACWCWRLFATARVQQIAAVTLASGVLMHAGIAIDRLPRRSLYIDRPLVQAAILAPNDRLIGDRRDTLQETQNRAPRPEDPVHPFAFLQSDPMNDLAVTQADWSPVLGGRVARVLLAIRNESTGAAYLDVRYLTDYLDADGKVLVTREGIVKEVLQPGDERHWTDVTDGLTPAGTARVIVRITGAEKCIPANLSGRDSG